MTSVRFSEGFSVVPLGKNHNRKSFNSGEPLVDQWIQRYARQSQEKRLSVTRVLVEEETTIAGYFTLAMGQVSLDALPHDMARKLPSTLLPIVTLAWLGIDRDFQGRGLGGRLLAKALADCHATGMTMPFVAVILDCLGPRAKSFYQHYDFQELPGHPMKLMLPWSLLDAMMGADE